jgi:hypothetical protein
MYEGNTSRQEQKEWFHDKGDEDQDFYKDFKGVPIYDPSKDYENMNHFDV